jgi:hypothetical protein
MARDIVRRLKRYERKFDVENIAKQFNAAKEEMEMRHKAAQIELFDVELRTKAVLGQCSVPTILYPAYLNFARQVWKLHKNFIGGTLQGEIQVTLDKWAARKLERDILDQIRAGVFSVKKPEQDKEAK